jgi:hypothetical protein
MSPVSKRVNTAETPTTDMTKRINSFILLLASQGVHFTPNAFMTILLLSGARIVLGFVPRLIWWVSLFLTL